jgi:hypothetical protein
VLSVAAALTVLVTVPTSAPATYESPGPCNVVLERTDADSVLDGLTAGYVEVGESEGEIPHVRSWPKREGRRCTWQGKFGTLILKMFEWSDADQRQEFVKRQLCFHEAPSALCRHARDVREEDDAGDASKAYYEALLDLKGDAHKIVNAKNAFWLDQPGDPKRGSFSWGPRGKRILLLFSCIAHDPAKSGVPQDRCAIKAMQLAYLNYR